MRALKVEALRKMGQVFSLNPGDQPLPAWAGAEAPEYAIRIGHLRSARIRS